MLDRPVLEPSIALAAYAESLVDGQRVVVFGQATSNLAEQLLDRGARLVHVYDTDPTRAAEAAARNRSQNTWFAPLADGELALRERSFDLALVENLAAHPEPRALLRRIRRTLTGRGAALVACPNPDVRLRLLSDPTDTHKILDYYALYDAVAEQFPHVRMLGQMPFVGYALADFGTEREPEPTFDSGFVPGGAEEPEWFIALGSEHPTRLDEFAVVQLPFRAAVGSTKNVVLEQQLRTAIAAERRSRERLAELEAQLARAAEQARARPARSPESGEPGDLRREIERRESWIAELEARATAADERADATQSELEEERTHNAELRSRLTELERIAASAAAVASAPPGEDTSAATAELSRELEQSRQRIAELEQRAVTGEQTVSELKQRVLELARSDDEAGAKEIAGLEAQLVERGSEIRRLERELREAERIGKELLRELRLPGAGDGEERPAQADDKKLRQKLDALAALNADREAELTSARWAIQALEARLDELRTGEALFHEKTEGEAGTHEKTEGAGSPGLLADSGQPPADSLEPTAPLEAAQADLQRQAVLMEQVRSPRGA